MKKIILGMLLFCLCGCASVVIPNYIHDKNAYKKLFYASFDKVRESAVKSLKETGWVIEKESEPALFERERDTDGKQQTLIFTEIRDLPFFVGSGYERLNVYVNEISSNEIEIEVRYLKVTSVTFKTFHDYKNDFVVNKVLSKIEENLTF